MNPLDQITGLDVTRWERARKQAQQLVREMVSEPDKRRYTGRAFQKFPGWVTAVMLTVLAIIAIAAFWISAGKQIAATDLALTPIVRDYNRLSPAWADVSILLSLLLGELGTVLFFTAAGVFPGSTTKIGPMSIKLLAITFRIAGIMCACFAVLANITITALHAGSYADIAVFGWFMTFAPPIVVLWVGLFFERLLMVTLEARATARELYNQAYDLYESVQRNPENHPAFKRIWHMQILDQLMKVSVSNRRKIEAAPELRADLVRREFIRHEWADFTVELSPSRPMIPLATGESYPSPIETLSASPNGSEQPSATP